MVDLVVITLSAAAGLLAGFGINAAWKGREERASIARAVADDRRECSYCRHRDDCGMARVGDDCGPGRPLWEPLPDGASTGRALS